MQNFRQNKYVTAKKNSMARQQEKAIMQWNPRVL
jgi:hypothetical protein